MMITLGLGLALTGLPQTAVAEVSCREILPRILEKTFTRVPTPDTCQDARFAVATRLSVARICYNTGFEEDPAFTERAKGQMITQRVRKGGEIQEVEVFAKPRAKEMIARGRSIDAFDLVAQGVMCVGDEAATFGSGTWAIAGRDQGIAFTAEGFLPTPEIRLDLRLEEPRHVILHLDLPPLELEGDPAPRKITGTLAVPID